MKLSQYIFFTQKEIPRDSEIKSYEYLIRGSFISKESSGIFTFLPLGFRVLKNIEKILVHRMEEIGAQQVHLPYLSSLELWEKSGRLEKMKNTMFVVEDRQKNAFALAPTCEEASLLAMREYLKSMKNYPFHIFQITMKFRDEIRPRFGLMRVKEFLMKDAYSFHTNKESMDEVYELYKTAYTKIFQDLSLPAISVIGNSGDMGGKKSEEFVILSHMGENMVVICSDCDYRSNQETATQNLTRTDAVHLDREEMLFQPQEKMHTPALKSIADLSQALNVPATHFAKTLLWKSGMQDSSYVLTVIRGDRDIQIDKLCAYLQDASITLVEKEELERVGFVEGFMSPYAVTSLAESRGLDCKVLFDTSLQLRSNYIVGADEVDYHIAYLPLVQEMERWNAKWVDIHSVQEADACPTCANGSLHIQKTIELGHIFQLGQGYATSLGASFLDSQGEKQFPFMGSYGIGLGRVMSSLVEHFHDEKGILWPWNLAPFQIIILPMHSQYLESAEKLYEILQKQGHQVALDDRAISNGQKFQDVDLLGLPLRITVGKAFVESRTTGWKLRHQDVETQIELDLNQEESIARQVMQWKEEYQSFFSRGEKK